MLDHPLQDKELQGMAHWMPQWSRKGTAGRLWFSEQSNKELGRMKRSPVRKILLSRLTLTDWKDLGYEDEVIEKIFHRNAESILGQ